MEHPYREKEVGGVLAFLVELEQDLAANGEDALLCFAASVGLIKQKHPREFFPSINPTRRGKLAIIPCGHGESARLQGMLEKRLDPQVGVSSRRAPFNSLQTVPLRYRIAKVAKHEYDRMGGFDPCNVDYDQILTPLKAKFPDDMVDLGLLEARPFIEAVNRGATKVIVAHTMIATSKHTEEIEERIAELQLNTYGIEVTFTEPLWRDADFIRYKVNRILDIVGPRNKSQVGVVILAYGMPAMPSPGRLIWANAESNNHYVNAYMETLKMHGIEKSMVGYLRWLKPDLADSAKIMAENEAHLIIFDWFHVTRNLHSLLDIPDAFQRLRKTLPKGTELVLVGPEKDDPRFIDVLTRQIENAKKRMDMTRQKTRR